MVLCLLSCIYHGVGVALNSIQSIDRLTRIGHLEFLRIHGESGNRRHGLELTELTN